MVTLCLVLIAFQRLGHFNAKLWVCNFFFKQVTWAPHYCALLHIIKWWKYHVFIRLYQWPSPSTWFGYVNVCWLYFVSTTTDVKLIVSFGYKILSLHQCLVLSLSFHDFDSHTNSHNLHTKWLYIFHKTSLIELLGCQVLVHLQLFCVIEVHLSSSVYILQNLYMGHNV